MCVHSFDASAGSGGRLTGVTQSPPIPHAPRSRPHVRVHALHERTHAHAEHLKRCDVVIVSACAHSPRFKEMRARCGVDCGRLRPLGPGRAMRKQLSQRGCIGTRSKCPGTPLRLRESVTFAWECWQNKRRDMCAAAVRVSAGRTVIGVGASA